MFKKLVFQNFREEDLPQTEWKRIAAACQQVCHVKPDELHKNLKDADGLLVKLGTKVDRQEVDAASQLKIIGMFGTGYGRINTEYAKEKNIAVFNVADYATQSVAEFVFGALLNHIRDLPCALLRCGAGDYSEGSFVATQLRDKTIGIIGLGAIGARVAEIASNGFSMNVLYWSRKRKKDREGDRIKYAELENVLSNSDYISLHLALTPETESFMSADRIDRIRSQAVLINTAPMELFDVHAVEQRLGKDDLALILDHSDEMSPEDVMRLNNYSQCTVYPPIAYMTKEATARKQMIFVDNIIAASMGKAIPNKVN